MTPEQQFRSNFDSIVGQDQIFFHIGEFILQGYILVSPLAEKLDPIFNYDIDDKDDIKPYKAQWVIIDSRLYIDYAHGIKLGDVLHSKDLIPEYCGESKSNFYNEFSGDLVMTLEHSYYPPEIKRIIRDSKHLRITFDKGVLVSLGPN